MEKKIPKVDYNKKDRSLDIEVMSLSELWVNLDHAEDHDPFSVHKIEFFLILVLTKSTYTHFVDFKQYELKKGSAIFVAKNQVHHFYKSLRKAEGYCVIFNSQFLDKDYSLSARFNISRLFNYHITTPIIHQNEINEKDFADLFLKLFAEYKLPESFGKSEILSALLHVILLKAERVLQLKDLEGVKTQWVETFNNFKMELEANYMTSRSSRTYASKLFVSYKSLNEIIKKLSGKTAKSFIDDYVVIEIKRYLASTAHSVKEISYLTGFDEPSNMVNFFKKNTSLTPLKFRQQFQ